MPKSIKSTISSQTILMVIVSENLTLCPADELGHTLNEVASKSAYFSNHVILRRQNSIAKDSKLIIVNVKS